MKITYRAPSAAGAIAGRTFALWRYLDRLADGWEYARDTEIAVVEEMLAELEREALRPDTALLPSGTADFLTTVRHAVARARITSGDTRMRHLEAAERSLQTLRGLLPAHI
ncbi:hypothetical protein BH23GEM3_BH23GEM3_06070 [soil metagenome]|nr:hypothetical protein [Gemmatimonadota bacterium]